VVPLLNPFRIYNQFSYPRIIDCKGDWWDFTWQKVLNYIL